MTDPSSLSRPARTAGLALLGVAGLALVIGGVTALTSGDAGGNQASPNPDKPAASAPPQTGDGKPKPKPEPKPTKPSKPSQDKPSTPVPEPPQPPPADAGSPGSGQDQQAAHSSVPLRVYNNSTIKGLAENAASDFRSEGWNVSSVGNYSGGTIPVTTAYFRPGTDEEAAAKQLAHNFGLRAEPRFTGIQQSAPGVIVIVTNNYEGAK